MTEFDELKAQTQLHEKLASYPVFAQGEGYIIYRLPLTMTISSIPFL